MSVRLSMIELASLLLVCLVLTACADRQRRNPLDPDATGAAFDVGELEARAGDGRVELRWDFSRFEDISVARLHRQMLGPDSPGESLVRDLPKEEVEFVDEEVENGETYRYQLAIVVSGEGERLLARTQLATPGPESGWVADVGNNRVWKLAPDGRSAKFERGPFPDIKAIALNSLDSSCWVSDSFLGGLVRISAAGQVELFDIDLGEPGDLSLAPDGSRGWIADAEQRRVYSFAVEIASPDSADLSEVDASFAESVLLSATVGGCWIGDSAGGRIILTAEDGSRVGEWSPLDRLGPLAAGPSSGALQEADSWALIRDGGGLIHLTAAASAPVEVEMPFSAGVALDVDAVTGNCWVLGREEDASSIATFDRSGTLLRQWRDLPLLDDLAVDGSNHQVWLVGRGVTWKLAIDADDEVQLTGFGRPIQVEVDPGRRP